MSLIDPPADKPDRSRAMAFTVAALVLVALLIALATDRLGTLDMRQRLALKTLVMPGGLGSTMKTMIFGKGVGRPSLQGTSSGRLT